MVFVKSITPKLTFPLTLFLAYNLSVEANPEKQSPRNILAGKLRRDFVVLPDGELRLDVPGGNLLFAAAGLAVWEADPRPGLVSRVGKDFPPEWLAEFSQHGFDVRGIKVLDHDVDLRSFYAYPDPTHRIDEDPMAYFSSLGQPFPKALYGYQVWDSKPDSRTRLSPTSLRHIDFIPDYMEATGAHICPIDYLTHSLLPAVLRQAGFTYISLDPSPGYMVPAYRDDIASIVTGLNAFLPSEEEVRALYHEKTADLWEVAEAFSSYGCEIIVIKRGEKGQLLYDSRTRKRWEIPAYPVEMIDPTGAGDAFCGGFLAGFRRTFDPVQAAVYGNISASLAIEGHGPFYALDSLPGLAQARFDALLPAVREV
ncbi:MAG: carbohydrate kinase family protein [Anaerolineales bacterium]|jgi:sugar/nucleoside kinase (ribokinase family)